MRMLSNELTMQYELNVKKYQYNRSNYYLETNKGKYILRKVNIPKEQVIFEYEVNEYIHEQEFEQIAKICLNKKKVPYSIYKDKIYIMERYIDCQETDFKEVEDLKNITRVLAIFHKAGTGMKSQVRNIENASIKNIYEYFEKRHIESRKLRKRLAKLAQKTPFEIMFLKDYRVYEQLEKIALQCISVEDSNKLIAVAKENQTLIHNDYNYHAVSRVTKERYVINNLDSCVYNIQIVDLANLLTRIMQKNNWDIDLLKELIDIYNTYRPLSEAELRGLKAMLIFPEKYANICSKYLNSKRRAHYNMFEVKWQNMLEYRDGQLAAAYKIQEML
ncbi:MAG: CotS family spore coat protein [Cellulosilyticaceae bacterium]